jgi:hypothetical protein
MEKSQARIRQRCNELIEQHGSDREAPALLERLVQSADFPTRQAVDIFLRYHLASKEVGKVCFCVAERLGEEEAAVATAVENLARAVLAKNPHNEVKAITTLALAHILMARTDSEKTQPAERDALLKESESLACTAVEKYQSVAVDNETSAGALATRYLYEIRRLQPGKPAPRLAAQDLDGKRFDLADYRGKVVVLIFWQFG